MRFEVELEGLRPWLRQHCGILAGCAEDAEDLTQQTMVRAWLARESFGADRPLVNWVIRIAERLNLDRKRLAARRVSTVSYDDPELSLLDLVPDPEPGIEEVLSFRVERDVRIRAVEAMTPDLDHVFIRKVLSGKSNQEIAEEMGTSRLAVRHRSHRLHRRLGGAR